MKMSENDKEMLSQEEIDALLKQGNDDDDATEELKTEDYLTPVEQDAMGEIGNISLGSAATALATLVNQKVDITTPMVDVIHLDHLDKEFPQPHVSVHVEYTEGFKGTNLFVIQQDDAKIIADLMMGGEGVASDEELSDLHISAVQEAMNQMMGSAATSMSTVFNKIVNISPPGIDIMDAQKGDRPEFDEDVVAKISFRLKVGDLIDSNIMQLVPVSFAKSMVQSLIGGGQEAEEVLEEIKEEGEAEAPQETPSAQPQTAAAESTAASHEQAAAAQPAAAASQAPPPNPSTMGGQTTSQANVQSVQFSPLDAGNPQAGQEQNLNLLLDIPLNVTVELGRTRKQIKDILDMAPGSIIELDKLAGEPVDILVNNKLIAKGEVVVIDENFGVRVTDIISQWDRVQKLQ